MKGWPPRHRDYRAPGRFPGIRCGLHRGTHVSTACGGVGCPRGHASGLCDVRSSWPHTSIVPHLLRGPQAACGVSRVVRLRSLGEVTRLCVHVSPRVWLCVLCDCVGSSAPGPGWVYPSQTSPHFPAQLLQLPPLLSTSPAFLLHPQPLPQCVPFPHCLAPKVVSILPPTGSLLGLPLLHPEKTLCS